MCMEGLMGEWRRCGLGELKITEIKVTKPFMVMFWYNSEGMYSGSKWIYSIQAGNESIRVENHILK